MPEHPGFSLNQNKDRSVLGFRVRPKDAEAIESLLKLPTALQWREGDPVAHWLSPDQWLFSSDTLAADEMAAQITHKLKDQLHATTDMSSHYACFALKGRSARTVLAMGCGIDMHPGAFFKGQCVRTLFAKVQLMIVAVEDDHFDLYFDRSHVSYLCGWIAKAGDDPMTHVRK